MGRGERERERERGGWAGGLPVEPWVCIGVWNVENLPGAGHLAGDPLLYRKPIRRDPGKQGGGEGSRAEMSLGFNAFLMRTHTHTHIASQIRGADMNDPSAVLLEYCAVKPYLDTHTHTHTQSTKLWIARSVDFASYLKGNPKDTV